MGDFGDNRGGMEAGSDSYDSMFDDATMRVALGAGRLARPAQYPQTAAVMGRRSIIELAGSGDVAGMTAEPNDNDRALRLALATSGRDVPRLWPKSAADMGRRSAYGAPSGWARR